MTRHQQLILGACLAATVLTAFAVFGEWDPAITLAPAAWLAAWCGYCAQIILKRLDTIEADLAERIDIAVSDTLIAIHNQERVRKPSPGERSLRPVN